MLPPFGQIVSPDSLEMINYQVCFPLQKLNYQVGYLPFINSLYISSISLPSQYIPREAYQN